MRDSTLALAALLTVFAAHSTCSAQNAVAKSASSSAAPLMTILDRFTAADVPALGPAEIEVPPPR